jgi:hypothetical protein
MEGKSSMLRTQDLQRTVTLDCVICSCRTTIHVDRKRWMPEFLPWECLDCQRSGPGISDRMGAARKVG